MLKFSTSRGGGLGDQLPSGTMRVYMRDKRGDPQFIGESRIEATPMGSAMSIRTGEAFDVKVKTVVEERTRISSSRWKTRMRYEITNARNNAITVDLGQNGLWGRCPHHRAEPGRQTHLRRPGGMERAGARQRQGDGDGDF